MTVALSKTQKFKNLLSDGVERTADQIARRTGLENVSSTVHRLRREQGLTIYTNKRGARGSKHFAYRMPATKTKR